MDSSRSMEKGNPSRVGDGGADANQIDAGSPAATAYPRWVLLAHDVEVHPTGSVSAVDAKTLVATRTPTGDPIVIFLRLAEPPAESCVCVDVPGFPYRVEYATVVAADGDSVLIHTVMREGPDGRSTMDYFVYNAGDAAADPPWPPSVSLLPPYYLAEAPSEWSRGRIRRPLFDSDTGILRRGEDELVVAELMVDQECDDGAATLKALGLLVFVSGEWSVKQPPIIYGDGKDGDLPPSWTTSTVLPVGERLLCWVDVSQGLIFSNVFDENPTLQYVPLPLDALDLLFGPESLPVDVEDPLSRARRDVCVTAGGIVKFVDILPRCC
ncbi:hypothetical protein ACP70R_008848 [Stipagrostis hirtigluma subsp. patula]